MSHQHPRLLLPYFSMGCHGKVFVRILDPMIWAAVGAHGSSHRNNAFSECILQQDKLSSAASRLQGRHSITMGLAQTHMGHA